MTNESSRIAKSLLEAAQHATGISVAGFAKWIGPVVGALWIWTPSGLVSLPPLLWLDGLARYGGSSAPWAVDTHNWLAAHPELFWPLLASAVFTASLDIWGIDTVTWASLLLGVSLRPANEVLLLFLLISFVLCLGGYAADQAVSWTAPEDQKRRYASFQGSVIKWMIGPPLTIGIAVALPGLLLAHAIGAYRMPDEFPPTPGDKPSSAWSPRETAAVAARALLVACGDDQKQKDYALWAIRRDEINRASAERLTQL